MPFLKQKKMPSYFEFTPGVRVMTSSENNYLKGVYEPFSKDITEIREYPFRYTLYEGVFFMGKEYKKKMVQRYIILTTMGIEKMQKLL